MKFLDLTVVVFTTLFLVTDQALGQGSFLNLDFEAALIEQTQPPGFVSVSEALPGWAVYYGTNQQTSVLYGAAGAGGTLVDLLGTNGASNVGFRSIEGGFSVLLQGGVIAGPGGILFATPASITQTGLVPSGSQSLLFKAQMDSGPPDGVFTVSLGGVEVAYFAVAAGPNYKLFGANVAGFSGQTVALEFSLSRLPDSADSNWNIDSIQFSPSTVPEPSGFALGAVGVLLFGWSVFRKRR